MFFLLVLVLVSLIHQDMKTKSVPLDLLMLFFLVCFLNDSFDHFSSFGIVSVLMLLFYLFGQFYGKTLLGGADLILFPFLAAFIPLKFLGGWFIVISLFMLFQAALFKQRILPFLLPLGGSWLIFRILLMRGILV
jgi:hypothetical protein